MLLLPSVPVFVISFALPKMPLSKAPLLTWKPQCEVHAHGNQSGFVGDTRLPSVQGEG